MSVTITGTYGTGIGPTYTWVDKKLLEVAKLNMAIAKLAQVKEVALGSGTTAQFTRLLKIPVVTSALTQGVASTPGLVYAQDFTVTVAEWGKDISVSSLLQDTFINPALEAYTELVGENAGESINLEMQKGLFPQDATTSLSAGCILYNTDADAYSTYNQTCTATSNGSTTTFASTGLTAASNEYIGGIATFTNEKSPNYGMARVVSDSTLTTTATITWIKAINVTPTTTSASGTAETIRIGHINQSIDLTAGTDVMTGIVCRRTKAMLRHYGARTFGGYFRGELDTENEFHLSQDTSAGALADMKYTTTAEIEGQETDVMHLGGIEWLPTNREYRIATTTPYAYSATGGLVVSFVTGQNGFARCGLAGQTDTTMKIKHPGPQTTSDTLDMFHTMGWKTTFARLSLNACHVVGIVTYPNAL